MARDSFRWRSLVAVDVDAFRLEGPGDPEAAEWFLFANVKSPGLVSAPGFLESLATQFTEGKVLGAGGALKTEKTSKPLVPVYFGATPGELWAVEAGLKFRLETAEVLNSGLFLDQALNRRRLEQLVKGTAGDDPERRHLLNLFSYTGSFSVVAAAAGAATTTSVDVSARYLRWEEANHAANIETEMRACGSMPVHRRIKDDARDFLRREVRRGSRYRWIVVDPPTFSKGEGKAFQVEKDLVPMLELAVALLEPGGAILASTNDAGWDPGAFYSTMESLANGAGLQMEHGAFPQTFGPGYPLKSVWLRAEP